MSVLLDIILPFFALMSCGYFCQARGVLGAGATEILNGFVFWFALPALLFRAMTRVEPSVLWESSFLIIYGACTVVVALLAYILGRVIFRQPSAEATMCGMNAGYGNTGYLGIPLSFMAFGEAAAVPTIMTTIASVLISVFCMAALSAIRLQQTSVAALLGMSLWTTAKNPLVIAPVAGFLVALVDTPLPSTIDGFAHLLGGAATPCALFSVGMFLYGKPLKGALPEVLMVSMLKLLALPLLVWLVLNTVFQVPPLWEAVAVIMAATPVGAGSFVLAKQFSVYEECTSTAIFLSTALSLIPLFLLLQYYLSRLA